MKMMLFLNKYSILSGQEQSQDDFDFKTLSPQRIIYISELLKIIFCSNYYRNINKNIKNDELGFQSPLSTGQKREFKCLPSISSLNSYYLVFLDMNFS